MASGMSAPGLRKAYALYDVAGLLFSAVALPVLPLLWFSRHGRGLGERLGMLPAAARQVAGSPLWVHAASVGEVLASEPLVRLCRQVWPAVPVVMSTTTVSGRETARRGLPIDAAFLLPVDVACLADRVMAALRPRALIIMETELWPALIRAAARRRVPRLVVSGRISAGAAGRYRRVAWLTRVVLAQIDAFAMQSEADAERIVALGAPADRVRVVGNLKMARDHAAMPPPAGTRWLPGERTVLVAASTHPGEEQLVLEACAGLWARQPGLLLLLAPRRPERFDEVEALLRRAGVRYERRTQLQGTVAPPTQVLLLDTLGELTGVLPAARAVFVGGTVAPVGGHNVAEPALVGKPVAFGPETGGVAAVAAVLLDAGAATRITDAATLQAEWARLLEQPLLAAKMGAAGRAVAATGATIAQATLDLIRQYVNGVDA
jgi:3-deoxy-D-manno-octulosonic-acid transferase